MYLCYEPAYGQHQSKYLRHLLPKINQVNTNFVVIFLFEVIKLFQLSQSTCKLISKISSPVAKNLWVNMKIIIDKRSSYVL